MNNRVYTKIETDLGVLVLVADGEKIVRSFFEDQLHVKPSSKDMGHYLFSSADSVFKQAAIELDEYFYGENAAFTVPYGIDEKYKDSLTVFEQECLNAVNRVSYGETVVYKELLHDNLRSSVSVAHALLKNPLSIFIPTHRVIGKDSFGSFVSGEKRKSDLIALEKKFLVP